MALPMINLPGQPPGQPPIEPLDASERFNQVINDIGETVLATTQVAEDIAIKLSSLTQQVQQQQSQIQAQGHQIQAQGQQILALSQAIELIAQNHDDSSQQLTQLIDQLQSLTVIMEQSRKGDT
jgi:chromosome segregation ATPase